MRLRFPRWFTRAAAALLALLLLALGGIYAWLSAAPRDVAWLLPTVHDALERSLPGWDVTLGSANAEWGGFGHPFTLHFHDANAFSPHRNLRVSVPDLRVGMRVWPLLTGRLEPAFIRLSEPVLRLSREAGESLALPSFGGSGPAPDRARLVALRDEVLEKLRRLRLRRIELEKARVVAADDSGGQEVELALLNLHLRQKKRELLIKTELLDDASPIVTADFHAREDGRIDAKLNFVDINPKRLSGTLPEWFEQGFLDAPLQGRAGLSWMADGSFGEGNFALWAEEGTVVSGMHFAEPFALSKLHLEGELSERGEGVALTVTGLGFQLGKATLEGKADLIWGKEGPEADAFLQIRDMPADDLHRYWPVTLKPHTRNWVTTRIRKGVVPIAAARVKIRPGDLGKMPAPPELLEAHIRLEGAEVAYVPGLPPAHAVSGDVYFTARSMRIEIEDGRVYDTGRVTRGTVAIPDFSPYDPALSVRLEVEASGGEVVRFLGEPYLDHARKLDVTPDRVTGAVKGVVSVWFPLVDELYEDGPLPDDLIRYDIRGDATGVSAAGVAGWLDFKDASAAIGVDNRLITAEGKGGINGVPLTMQWTTWLGKNTQWDNAYRARGVMPAEALPRFRLPQPLGVSGRIAGEAEAKMKGDIQHVEGALDLTEAGLDEPDLALKKAPGSALKATFALDVEKDGSVNISKLSAEGENTRIAGSLRLPPEGDTPSEAAFDPLIYGRSDLALRFTHHPVRGYDLTAGGKAFDLAPFLKGNATQQSQSLPPFVIKAQLGALHLPAGSLSEVTLNADCVTHCESLSLRAMAGKPVTAYIRREGEARRFSLRAEDGGELIKRLNIHEQVTAGVFTASGAFAEDQPGKPLSGTFDLQGMKLSQAPLLARLLSLASVSGITDVLSGKDLSFNRVSGKFRWQENSLHLEDAHLIGSGIGITAKGEVNLNRSTLALEGTVVPAYMLNNVFTNIPILGTLLSGGEDKGGIFAASYSVRGPMDNPDIRVNPLSMLTPGFLRNIFGIFDGARPVEDKPAGEAPATETPPPLPEEKSAP